MFTDQDLLRYPISLVTAAAMMEGIVKTLCDKYIADGVDGRGRRLGKHASRSARIAAEKCCQGVRWDIRDVLEITDVGSLSSVVCDLTYGVWLLRFH